MPVMILYGYLSERVMVWDNAITDTEYLPKQKIMVVVKCKDKVMVRDNQELALPPTGLPWQRP